MRERFEAYKTALDANFMQIDEVRYAEDMEPLGMTWVKLGLQDVLYDPKTKQIYTPNTNKVGTMGQNDAENLLPDDGDGAIIEPRANPYHDPKTGRFTSGRGGKGRRKTKYAPSKQVNASAVSMSEKTYARLCGVFKTWYPEATPEDGQYHFRDGKYMYVATAAENGGLIVHARSKIK